MSEKIPKYILKLLRDLLVIRPCRHEKGEGNCVIKEEHKSYIMITYEKFLYVY